MSDQPLGNIITNRGIYEGAVWWRAYAADDPYLFSWDRSRRAALRRFSREHPIWLRCAVKQKEEVAHADV